MEVEDEGINRYIWILKTTTYGFQPLLQLNMEFKDNYNDIWNLKTFTHTYGLQRQPQRQRHMDSNHNDNDIWNLKTTTYGF
jgi:hypothetical protein